jgi:hypothetical protein
MKVPGEKDPSRSFSAAAGTALPPPDVAVPPQLEGSCAGRDAQDAYAQVAAHFGLPLVSFRDAATAPGFHSVACREEVGGGFSHPPWRVHQLVADVVAHFFEEQQRRAAAAAEADANAYNAAAARCRGALGVGRGAGGVSSSCFSLSAADEPADPVEPAEPLPAPMFPLHELESATLCTVRTGPSNALETRPTLTHLNPLETMASGGAVHGTNVRLISNNGWRCFDDRAQSNAGTDPGRPGWISSVPGSVLSLEFETSDFGALGLSFLQSFEGFSGARVQIDGKSYAMPPESSLGRGHGVKQSTKLRFLPSYGSVIKNAHGAINARWEKPYSLPEIWAVRRLNAGQHTISIELLSFNSTLLANAQPPHAVGSELSGGKFKILGIMSC